jgi:hypothetical protein
MMMKRNLLLIVAVLFASASTVSLAGVSPTQGSSAMSQSGAKIAAPKKQEEDRTKDQRPAQKDEKS